MNRTLRRPMFRMGGSAEGITSGLDAPAINKRGLVDGPGGYSGEENNLVIRNSSNGVFLGCSGYKNLGDDKCTKTLNLILNYPFLYYFSYFLGGFYCSKYVFIISEFLFY